MKQLTVKNSGRPDLTQPASWAKEVEDEASRKDKAARKAEKTARRNAKKAENQADVKARMARGDDPPEPYHFFGGNHWRAQCAADEETHRSFKAAKKAEKAAAKAAEKSGNSNAGPQQDNPMNLPEKRKVGPSPAKKESRNAKRKRVNELESAMATTNLNPAQRAAEGSKALSVASIAPSDAVSGTSASGCTAIPRS